MIKLLGICGFAGSGKDTVGDILTDYRYTKIAFADPIKRAVMDWYGFTEEQLWGNSYYRNLPDKRYFRSSNSKIVEENIKKGGSPFIGVRWNEEEEGWQIKIDDENCAIVEKLLDGTGSPKYKKIYLSGLCYETEEDAAALYDEIMIEAEGMPNLSAALLPQYISLKNSDLFLTPRKALQTVGTEIGRALYQDTWVDYTLNMVKALNETFLLKYDRAKGLIWDDSDGNRRSGVVIVDLRFFNELEKIKDCGGKIIKVQRNNAGLKGSAGIHQSEQEMLEMKPEIFDYIIDNNGTIEELREKISVIMNDLSD